MWLRIGEAFEQLDGARQVLLFRRGEICSNGTEQPVFARPSAGLDPFAALGSEGQNGLSPVARIRSANHESSRLQDGNSGAHGLRTHRLGARESGHCRGTLALQSAENRQLRGAEISWMCLFTEP